MKKSWKMMVVLVCLVCLSVNVFAEDDAVEPGGVTGSYSIGMFDKYMGQWSGAVFDKRSSIQGEITVDLPNNFYAGIWFARQIGAVRDDLDGNELDLNVGWSGEVMGMSVEPGLSYYDLIPVLDGRKDNIWAPNLKVSKNYDCGAWTISPFGRIEVPIPDTGSDFDGGMYLSVGAEDTMTFSDDFTICLSPYITYDDETYGAEENYIFFQCVSATYSIGDFDLSPSFLLSCPILKDEGRKVETCFGISLSGGF